MRLYAMYALRQRRRRALFNTSIGGTLPHSWSQLQNIQYLYVIDIYEAWLLHDMNMCSGLGRMRLEGELPPQWSRLVNLTVLYVYEKLVLVGCLTWNVGTCREI